MIFRYLFLFGILSLPAFGRLGETESQCEARYGPLVRIQDGTIKDDLHKQYVFQKNGYELLISFVNKVAGQIVLWRQDGVPLTDQEAAALMEASKGAGTWTKSTNDSDVDPTWRESDGSTAVSTNDGHGLVLTSAAFTTEEGKVRSAEDAVSLKSF